MVENPSASTNEILKKIHALLAEVPDPEVPAISIVDLGIVRDVQLEKHKVIVTITPTYSGCPAMAYIEQSIVEALHAAGFEEVMIKTVLAPAWTTDWMSEAGKQKLKAFGIAPPLGTQLVNIGSSKAPAITCPYCDSKDTRLRSEFGATSCKALYSCNACLQPFEYFKPH